MRRRQFLGVLGGVAAGLAASCPLAARAQQADRIRRIGIFTPLVAGEPEAKIRIAAFLHGLEQLGWTVGRNLQIDYRWGGGNVEAIRKYSAELAALAPDAILATGSSTVGPLLQATRSVPIVFVVVPDPVGAGFVDSLARPGGNATGFIQFEYGISGKWLELLKEIAPNLTRVAILRDAAITAGTGQWGAVQSVAPALRLEIQPINLRNATDIQRDIETFARLPNGGMIVTGSALSVLHRALFIELATRHKLPTIYFEQFFAKNGGLMSYGPNLVNQYRQAATYVDRILKGEQASNLPVQTPTKYDLVINLKAAKDIGLTVPPTLLARADEVIE